MFSQDRFEELLVRRGDVIDYADISDFVNLFFENLVGAAGIEPASPPYQGGATTTQLRAY